MRKAAIFVLILLILTACSGAGEGDPAEIVESYLQVKVDGDREAIGSLLCSEMEANLERESRSFESVSDVRIDGMACELISDSNGVKDDGVKDDVVHCEGKIVALYGAEETEFTLANYRVVQEDGAWKWCGEAP